MDNIIQLKTISFLNKLMPTDDLPIEEKRGLLYKNAPLCFQLAIKNQKIIIDGAISIRSELKNIEIKKVGYVGSTVPVREDCDDYVISQTPGLYPDCLFDVNCDIVRLPAGINNVFLITVESNVGLKKGVYPVTITLLDKKEPIATVNYDIEYTDVELETPSEKYANWMHYDSISVLHNVKPFTAEFYDILKNYLKLLKRSGGNVLMVPLITPPLDTHFNGERVTTQLLKIVKKDGKYIFDFKDLDYFIDFVFAEGIEYLEFPPFYSQWGAKYAPKFVVEIDGKEQTEFGWKTDALSTEYTSFLSQMLSELNEFLHNKGCCDKCYFHVSDETDKYKDHYLKCKNIITKNLNDVHYIDTVTKAENILENNDVQVLSISETVNLPDVEKVKSIYYCWGDYKNYVSNRFFSMPLERTAVIWIQMYLNKADFLLHWGFNYYQDYLSYNYVDPYANTDVGGIFPSGDAFIVYPDIHKGKALSSIRLEAMRYGRDMLALLYTLEKITSRDYVVNKLKKLGFVGYNVYPRKQGWLKELEIDLCNDVLSRKGN